jgi:hypothetical protein
MSSTAELDGQALDWLARLPFLCAYDLSALLSIGETRAQRILSELEGMGWCEWVAASSRELDERRLYVLTEAAQNRVSELPSARTLPIGRRETLARLQRLETAAGLNRFLRQLAVAAAAHTLVEAVDVQTLPWTATRSSRFWPPDVEAYACFKWQWSAPYFIAWDRAAAPAVHRRKRVSGWYAHALSRRWQTPPILVVCPSEREVEEWARAIVISADRRACPPLTVFLATARAAQIDPTGEIWRRADGRGLAPLLDLLTHLPHEKAPIRPSPRLDLDLGKPPAPRVPLRAWAVRVAGHPDGASGSERVAALSLVTGEFQKRALEWISHHTLLRPADLSALMNVPVPLAEKLLAGLETHELGRRLPRSDASGTEAPRYLLTRLGLRLVSARDGVPPRRYVRYGVVAAPDTYSGKASRRLDTLVSQFEHTVGTNTFFVRLARDLRAQGGLLLRWLNASEATERFVYREKQHWLRPDGYAEIELGRRVHRLFLEWDRGTTRHTKHLTEKFENYAHYFATHTEPPDLLIVTVTPQRESVIWGFLRDALDGRHPASVLTSIDSLVERLGPLGNVWRPLGGSSRMSWPGHATLV